jgi:trk system potassium uptake protein TrkA
MELFMKIVIIGNGSLGDTLISSICDEGHSVTVIDDDADEVNSVVNKYDVLGIMGNGASVEIQEEAGVADADVVIAVAGSDELNLLCCMIAKQLGAKHAIARVRDPEYLNQKAFMCNGLGIDMIVNPEHEAAREACRMIRFPVAMMTMEKFAQGQVEAIELHIGEGHPFVDQPLISFKGKYNTRALICVARRGDDVIIPGGDYVIKEGDTISIAASRVDMTDLFSRTGLIGKQIKDVMLVGGGTISRYLASQLIDGHFRVKIIEKNIDVCEDLAELFPEAVIIHGDATNPDLLDDEGIDGAGACVVMTANDQTNFIISMFAQTRGVKKVISKLSSSTLVKLASNSGIDSNIIPQRLTVAKVIRYIRGLDNTGAKGHLSQIKSLHKMMGGRVEALEFDVAEDFKFTNTPLRSIKLKKNLLIAAIIRESEVIYPDGDTTMQVGDSVIVMTTIERLYDLGDIIA